MPPISTLLRSPLVRVLPRLLLPRLLLLALGRLMELLVVMETRVPSEILVKMELVWLDLLAPRLINATPPELVLLELVPILLKPMEPLALMVMLVLLEIIVRMVYAPPAQLSLVRLPDNVIMPFVMPRLDVGMYRKLTEPRVMMETRER